MLVQSIKYGTQKIFKWVYSSQWEEMIDPTHILAGVCCPYMDSIFGSINK
jgi:hypothetical protein